MVLEHNWLRGPQPIVALVVDDYGTLVSLNDMRPFAATMYQSFDAASRFIRQDH